MSHIETGPNCSLTSNVFFRAATTSISTASIILLLESLDLFPSYENLFFFSKCTVPSGKYFYNCSEKLHYSGKMMVQIKSFLNEHYYVLHITLRLNF